METTLKWSVTAALSLLVCVCGSAVASSGAQPPLEDDPLMDTECSALLEPAAARRAMQLVRAQLSAQGMKLVVQACPFVRVSAGDMQQVLDVRVQVVNSEVAAKFVRGPLADGQELDMGGVYFHVPRVTQSAIHGAPQTLLGAHSPEEDVSPDVLFNRQWLSQVMQTRGLQPVGGYWWAFVPVVARP